MSVTLLLFCWVSFCLFAVAFTWRFVLSIGVDIDVNHSTGQKSIFLMCLKVFS